MTFTYSDTDISTDLAKVRLIISDTDSSNPLLTDEEINYFLSVNSNVYSAAALAANAIQAEFARLADTTVESVSVKYSQRAEQYAKLASDVSNQAADQDLVTPSVFGVDPDDIEDNKDNSNRVRRKFAFDQFSNPVGYDNTDDFGADS